MLDSVVNYLQINVREKLAWEPNTPHFTRNFFYDVYSGIFKTQGNKSKTKILDSPNNKQASKRKPSVTENRKKKNRNDFTVKYIAFFLIKSWKNWRDRIY